MRKLVQTELTKMPTQSVTKSSHYVSVQQTSSSVGGGTSSSRYLSWTVGGRSHYFCSLPGILRIIEILLIIIVVIMARVGNSVSSSISVVPSFHTLSSGKSVDFWWDRCRLHWYWWKHISSDYSLHVHNLHSHWSPSPNTSRGKTPPVMLISTKW